MRPILSLLVLVMLGCTTKAAPVASSAGGCSGSATPSPVPPPAPSSTISAACAQLASLGCQEGTDSSCVATMTQTQNAQVTALPIACWASASSKSSAIACGGGLRCP
jgi:hypothetical protein